MTDQAPAGSAADTSAAETTKADAWSEWDKIETDEGAAEGDDDRAYAASGAVADPDAPPPQTTEPTDAPPADAGKSEGEGGDPWASAPEMLKKAHQTEIERREAEIARLQQKYRSDVGRQTAYQTKIAELEAQLAAVKAAPPDARKGDEAAGGDGADDFEELVDIYGPKFGELVDRMRALESKTATTQSGREAIEAAKAELRAEVEIEKVSAVAGQDWRGVFDANRDEFGRWVVQQDAATIDAVRRNNESLADGAALAPVMRRFFEHLGIASPSQPATAGNGDALAGKRREAQMKAASSPRTNAPPMREGPPPPDAPKQTQWAYWDKMEKAGRVAGE